ncbi:MAG: 5-(carboxyamino)imidazole ribonucleotide mutase [Dehalococcoidia bacterium]
MSALVAVLMGSKSDMETMQPCMDTLQEFGIAHEVHVMSAHRTPDRVREFVSSARERGFEVIIAAAGGAAALPGVCKSHTPLPVIGVPLASSELKGIDALYSIVQMPPGIPVATVSVGSWGARNAAMLAAEILALKHNDVRKAYDAYRESLRGG